MKKLHIIYSKKACRGLGMCAKLSPLDFYMKGKKAILEKGKFKKGEYHSIISASKKREQEIIKAALSCPVNAIRVRDMKTQKELIPSRLITFGAKHISAQEYTWDDFTMDRKGYLLIRVDRQRKLLEVGLCKTKNKVDTIITGRSPVDVYYTILDRKLISRMEHAAYLGKELQKAYTAMQLNIEYIQDSPLEFKKKK